MSKPVAWMYQIHDITGWTWVIDQRLPDYEYRNEKPLYTHPVKELIGGYEVLDTNEHDITVRMTVVDWEAILRKAQEK